MSVWRGCGIFLVLLCLVKGEKTSISANITLAPKTKDLDGVPACAKACVVSLTGIECFWCVLVCE